MLSVPSLEVLALNVSGNNLPDFQAKLLSCILLDLLEVA